jgi:hypothetical protein
MLESIQQIATYLILAGVCAIGAWLLKSKKEQLLQVITNLCQRAEEAVQGSGLGPDKKALVIIQLEAAGIKVTEAVSKLIDEVVKQLNEKSGWFVNAASTGAKEIK